jgi:hypothetical protein
MPITDVLLLSFFIFAFVALTAALAWGDYQTHDIAKKSRAAALAGTPTEAPEKPTAVVEEKKKPKTLVHA